MSLFSRRYKVKTQHQSSNKAEVFNAHLGLSKIDQHSERQLNKLGIGAGYVSDQVGSTGSKINMKYNIIV